jgi:SAM-dependent methyltransferase
MISFIKKVVRKVTSVNRSISMKGTIPEELTNTQQMFLLWNAERLNISFQESQRRYFASWSAIRGGHARSKYRAYSDLSHNLFQVFFSDAEEDIYTAHEFYSPMHFLRMLSYSEPQWNTCDLIVQHLSNYSTVNIIDYGCGLAQRSRTLARYLKDKGIITNLVLVDIPTIRKEFLLWLIKQTDIRTSFLDCTAALPIPDLPRCDICFAIEFFEHVYEPIRYFDHIHAALRKNGLLVTNVSDHKKEFMHVSPNLHALRNRIQGLNYEELQPNRIYRKSGNDRPNE